MANKASLQYILATPRTLWSTSQPRSLFDYEPATLPSIRPLTSYLRHPRDAARVDRVHIQSVRSPRVLSSHDDSHTKERTLPAATKKSSKFCMVDGCSSRAKHARRCWKHGGSVKCKVPDCVNRAKSKGVCWSHGGGSPCSVEDCETIAVSNGFCWAHGGGKRCRERGCSRPAYERTHNLCAQHFDDAQQHRGQSFALV